MKLPQKERNLFTVDTVGAQNEFDDDDEYADFEMLYHVDGTKNIENTNNEEEEEDIGSFDDYGIDFGPWPPPSVDIISILKDPVLARKPLYAEKVSLKKPTQSEIDLDEFCNAMGWTQQNGNLPRKPADKQPKRRWKYEDIDLTDVHKDLAKTNVEKEMRACILNGIETKKEVKIPSEREAHRQRKAEASKTKGKNWFNMPATEVTDELRQDMEIIQMRSALNPTHFYKKNDLKTLPKYFQVGTVLPSPLEKYNDRGERVTKKRSLVDELLQDAEFQRYNKRKYGEVMAEKRTTGYKKAYKKMQKLKKN